MTMRLRYLLPVVAAFGAACGCGWRGVNCVLPEGGSPFMYSRPGDTTVVGYFRRAMQYAKIRRGNYDNFWYRVAYDVLKVERGRWKDKDLRFVCVDRSPTPESGIMLKKGRFPFRMGTVHAFSLNTSASPAGVVGLQERSRLPPHGPIVRQSINMTTFRKVSDSAMALLKRRGITKPGGGSVVEETADSYIFEYGIAHVAGSEIWHVVVRKDTLSAEFMPPPHAPQGPTPETDDSPRRP